MSRIIFRTIATLCLLTVITFAQNSSKKLISIDISDETISDKIELLNLTVLHQFESVLISSATENEISLMSKRGIKYSIIDETYSDNKYYLLKKDLPFTAHPQIVYEVEDYLLIKNISLERAVELKINPVPLKEKQHTFKRHDNNITLSISTDLDSVITNLTTQVNTDSITYFIQSLQDFKTRYCLSPNRKKVALWIKGEFERFGFEDVVLDSFYIINTWQYDVVATLHSDLETDKVIVIGGHHDSITRSNPLVSAPGADDNASGTTAVLEIARVLKSANYKPKVNLKFVTFAAEELGLYGGYYYAEKAKKEGMNIHLMINHDMISYSPLSVPSSRIDVNYYSGSEHFAGIAQSCITKFSKCIQQLGQRNSAGSDSYAFYSEGFDAVYFEESIFTPNYHTDLDLITNANMSYCTEVIKASCATIITSSYFPAKIKNLSVKDLPGGTSLNVSWEKSTDQLISGYNIYVGTKSGTYYKQLFTAENYIDVTDLLNGTQYFIGVSAINKDGYESSVVEKSYIPFNFKLDKGVLIVDETGDGNGTIMNPTDDEVDKFYFELLNGFSISELDASKTANLNVSNLGNYSTVVWHGDDTQNLTTLQNIQEDVKRYLNAGGNLIYVGYQPTKAFSGNTIYPSLFFPGDFLYDYLSIEKTDHIFGSRFSGAIKETGPYNDLSVDSTKTKSSTEFQLKNIESISASANGKNIYIYETKDDTTSYQGKMAGMSVGVENLGSKFKTVVISVPLYYINKEEAKEFIKTVLTEKLGETYVVSVKEDSYPVSYSLFQNYPNPFNSISNIKYQITNTENVNLTVYDVLGSKVITLVNKQQSLGSYNATFNSRNLPSGVYFYTLQTGGFSQTKKMVILR